MTQPTAFSYSRLNNFDECPKKFHALAIAKTYKEKETEAMSYGKAVHKALELRVAHGKPLPGHLAHLEPLSQSIVGDPGIKRTELQMAINAALEPTDWFAKDVYCRAIADLAVDRGRFAALFDYKTGKKSEDFMQLKLTSVLYFQHQPEVERIKCAFVWIKDKSVSTIDISRDEAGEVWSEMAPRIERYQAAFREDEFPPRPGRHCRWCVVKGCPYWEGKV